MVTEPSGFLTQSGDVIDPQLKTTEAGTSCDPVPAASFAVTTID
jgi:hypothetical protein